MFVQKAQYKDKAVHYSGTLAPSRSGHAFDMTKSSTIAAAAALLYILGLFLPPAFASDKVAGTADVSALISNGLSLMRANRNSEAAAVLEHAIQLAPGSAEAHHNYGLALAKLGDTASGIEQLKMATKLKPDLSESWLTLAGLEQSAGQMQDAMETYNTFLKRTEDRTDLNDTRSKVKQLLKALSTEVGTAASEKNQVEQLQQPTISGILQPPAQAIATDDYLATTTRNGIFRWPQSRMPIHVFIHEAGSLKGVPGVPGYRPQWKEILTRSFQDWSAASQGTVKFDFVPDASAAQLECWFVAERTEDQSGLRNDAEAGETHMYVDQQGILNGKIKVLTKSLSPVLPLTDNRMRLICLHEIGHALGLAGHTTNPDDIMFYSTSFKDEWRELSNRDARTIQRLYASN